MAPPPRDVQAVLDQLGWLRDLARRLVHDPHAADDLSQETLVAAIRTPPSPDRPVRGWLATILRNFTKQHFRARERRERHERRGAAPEHVPSTPELLDRMAAQREVGEALLRLAEPYRTTLLLRYFEELPPRAIAEREGVPVATVHTRIARGIEALRAELDRGRAGDRRAWMAALAPIAGASPTIFQLWPIGASLVNAKVVLSAAAAAILVAAAWYSWSSPAAPGERGGASPGAPTGAARGEAKDLAASAAASDPAAAREKTAASAPAPESRAASRGAAVEDPGRIVGRVMDLQSRPVAGVEVRFVASQRAEADPKNPPPDPGLTDEDGVFEMAVPSVYGELEVASARYVTVFAGSAERRAGARRPILVVAPKATFAGSVLDEAARAIEGATVRLEAPENLRARFDAVLDFSIEREWSARSDARGRFELADLPVVEGAKLGFSKVGFATHREAQPPVSAWDLVIRLASSKAPAGAWAGRVLDPEGHPVAGAKVASPSGLVATDDAGRFSAPSMGLASATLCATKAGYQWVSLTVQADGGAGSGKSGIEIRLVERALSIAGTVVDDDGKPVPSARVWIDDAQWFGSPVKSWVIVESAQAGTQMNPIVTANSEGRFRLDGLMRRNYRIGAADQRTLASVKIDGVAAGSMETTIPIPKSELYAKLAGQVVSLAGKPVPGVGVYVWKRGFTLSFPEGGSTSSNLGIPPVRTDADGRFVIQRVARDGIHLTAGGDDIVPPESLTSFEPDPEKLRLVVAMRCHMKVELQNPNETIDGFSVLDWKGKALEIDTWSGSDVYGSPREKIVAGASHVVAVSEEGRTLVLFHGNDEVRRAPLALKPGEITVARP